jgi:hypothetical protein
VPWRLCPALASATTDIGPLRQPIDCSCPCPRPPMWGADHYKTFAMPGCLRRSRLSAYPNARLAREIIALPAPRAKAMPFGSALAPGWLAAASGLSIASTEFAYRPPGHAVTKFHQPVPRRVASFTSHASTKPRSFPSTDRACSAGGAGGGGALPVSSILNLGVSCATGSWVDHGHRDSHASLLVF